MINNKIIKKITNSNNLITIEKYIEICLYHKDGYYKNSEILGKVGDFTTSPEISQLFGEIIGLYIFNFWTNHIKVKFNLYELGPGNGSLIFDIINITKNFKEFNESIKLYLVEKNNKLIQKQKNNIKKNNFNIKMVQWDNNFNSYNKNPSIIFSNEFFDCFPTRQFFKKNNQWFEKMIGLNNKENNFKLLDQKVTDSKILNIIDKYKPKHIFELSKSRNRFFSKICNHIKDVGGLIILIDYGYNQEPNNFTLQAIHNNKKSNILDNIGEQDITSLVDFNQLITIAKSKKLQINYYNNQRKFLLDHGILERLKKILPICNRKQGIDLNEGVERLIDEEKMGNLFKVLIIGQ